MSPGKASPGDPDQPPLTDAAWVAIDTTWNVDELSSFVADVSRLIRLNPYLTIRKLERLDGDRVRLVAHNDSNGRAIDVVFKIARTANGSDLIYEGGLKAATRIRITPGAKGARLTIIDDYGHLGEAERQARAGDVDPSLAAWGVGVRNYLQASKRWHWLAPWRLYTERLWLPMSPRARRIARLLWAISALELVAFVAVVALWRAA